MDALRIYLGVDGRKLGRLERVYDRYVLANLLSSRCDNLIHFLILRDAVLHTSQGSDCIGVKSCISLSPSLTT